MPAEARNLIFILGDQLTPDISSLRNACPEQDYILMVKVMDDAEYAPHHKKKIAFIFSAMRHFAAELREQGWRVDYVELDAPLNTGSFGGELSRNAADRKPRGVVATEPSEWRVRQNMERWKQELGIPVEIREDDRFLCTHDAFRSWADGRKQFRMEFFYREMRRKSGLLMIGDEPVGEKWNFDSQNRRPAKPDLFTPQPHRTPPDEITRDVLGLVARRFDNHFGDLEPFWFAVTRRDAEKALDHFIESASRQFGDYQDAMLAGEKFLYHSVLSL